MVSGVDGGRVLDPSNMGPDHGDGMPVVVHHDDIHLDRVSYSRPCPIVDHTMAARPIPTKVAAGKLLPPVSVPLLTTGLLIVAHVVHPDCDPI